MPLKHVDPARPRGLPSRLLAAFSATRVGRFVSRQVAWRLDPWLMRVTGGRFGLAWPLPSALLETRGARTGAARTNAVLYFHDGDRVTIVASKAGADHHPAWFHNLRAHPDVTFGGIPMRAAVVADESERDRLWELADRVFPAFASYRRDAARVDRTIPIVQLTER